MTRRNARANMARMAAHTSGTPATHFGKQMRKERLAHGWTLREFAARTGINFSHAGRIETGHRPPTEAVARACDRVWPERRGWFLEYYEESRTWMPAGFRDWPEIEDKAGELVVWAPGIIDGLAQTEDYARALLSVDPGVTGDVVATRLRNRMERQKRLLRDDGPAVTLLIDMAALYRGVGSAEIMAGQMRRLDSTASGNVTVQVVPPVTIPLATASLILAGGAAYTENAFAGAVYTDEDTVRRLRRLITTVRTEARPASESLAIIRRAGQQWTGVRARTAATAGRHA
jgi:transcriptional regulator with XRE-family HTH domain